MIRRALLVLLVAGSCLGCDQITKGIARSVLAERDPISYLGDVIRLQYEENPGAMLSLGAQLPAGVRSFLLVWAVAAMLGLFLLYALFGRNLRNAQIVSLSLLLGGGFGNLADRIMHNGIVIDFVIVGFGPVRTAVFNLADVVIIAGVVGLFLSTFRRGSSDTPVAVTDAP